MSDQEMKIVIQQATDAGTFVPVQQDLMEAAVRFADRSVDDLMTPRPLVEWIDLQDPPEESLRKIAASPHQIFPVAEANLDQVLGIISGKRLLAQVIEGRPIEIRSAVAPAVYVVEHLPALKLIEAFKEPGTEMVIVVEEHGGVTGIVTLSDLLGAVTGDALPLGRRVVNRPSEQSDGSWLLDGLLAIDELKDVLNVESIPGEDRERYQSLGGFIFSRVGHVPAVGESFSWADWEFEVAAMQGLRIDKVLVKHR